MNRHNGIKWKNLKKKCVEIKEETTEKYIVDWTMSTTTTKTLIVTKGIGGGGNGKYKKMHSKHTTSRQVQNA